MGVVRILLPIISQRAPKIFTIQQRSAFTQSASEPRIDFQHRPHLPLSCLCGQLDISFRSPCAFSICVNSSICITLYDQRYDVVHRMMFAQLATKLPGKNCGRISTNERILFCRTYENGRDRTSSTWRRYYAQASVDYSAVTLSKGALKTSLQPVNLSNERRIGQYEWHVYAFNFVLIIVCTSEYALAASSNYRTYFGSQ